MKSKVLSAVLLTLFGFGLRFEVQAKPAPEPYKRLKANTARQLTFPTTSTDEGHIVVIQGNEDVVLPENNFDLEHTALRFTPNDNLGGYDLAGPFDLPTGHLDLDDDDTERVVGETLDLDDDGYRQVAIGFPFTFFGQEYTELFVNMDGNVTFVAGDDSVGPRDLQHFAAGFPRIGGFYADLILRDNERSMVDVKRWSDQLTITWFDVAPYEVPDTPITMSIILFDTGVIEILFEWVFAESGIVGISAGEGENSSEATLVDYSERPSIEGTPGAIAEVFVSISTVNLYNVAKAFYQNHGDDFDSLICFTNFESDLDHIGALAFAIPVQNKTEGLGMPTDLDDTKQFGSDGQLRTFISMLHLKQWDDNPLKNTYAPATSTLNVLAHEFGHGWGITVKPEALLQSDLVHWNFFLHTAGSVMGGNNIRDNGDGSFITLDPTDLYGPLDLYLMGLLPPEAISPTFLVVAPHDIDSPHYGSLDADSFRDIGPTTGVTFQGLRHDITIEDIIEINGKRIPHADASQKDFRVAFILLAQGQSYPSAEEIEKMEAVRRYWAPYFHRAADNLAMMNSTLDGSVEDVELPADVGSYTYTVALDAGLNNISLPLRPVEAFTAQSLMEHIDATMIMQLTDGKFISWTQETPGAGFPIEGGRGYIVNTPQAHKITFNGEAWSDTPADEYYAAPPPRPSNLWAFVVDGEMQNAGAYRVTLNNLRTGNPLAKTIVESGERLTLGFADLNRKPLVQIGDTLRLTFTDRISGEAVSKIDRLITQEDIRRAYSTLDVTLADLVPMTTALLQNYPNPFNPETWIPYQLAETSEVSISIYDATGQLVRTLQLGNQAAGAYLSRNKAAYWDGRNDQGERVSSNSYFYKLNAKDFAGVKRMVILK